MTHTRLALFAFVAALSVPAEGMAQIVDEVTYYHSDAIGSVRMITGASQQVVARYDYLPFGEPWPAEPNAPNPRGFGGKEIDSETGFDYFGARYYASGNGRFTTVDPVLNVDNALVNPQLWNRYAYAANNPLKFSDPDGREVRYGTPQLEAFFGFIAARSQTVRATLALYAGADNPDLFITQRALAIDPVDGRLSGSFTPSFDFSTDSPPGSGNFERLRGMSDAEIAAGLANGSLYTSAKVKSAELVLDSSLSLSTATLGRSRQERQAIGTAAHELGHADSAARDPLGHYRRSLPVNQMERGRRQPHHRRQIERDAEEYRRRVEREGYF